MAGHHVANGVAARLAAGQSDAGHQPHHLRDLGQLDIVDLYVLAGGDVPPAPRVGLGDVAHHVELLGRDRAGGQLDADHLVRPALTLAIDAVVEAHHPKDILLDLAGEVLLDCLLEAFDVTLLLGVEIARGGDDRGDSHGEPPGLNPTSPVNFIVNCSGRPTTCDELLPRRLTDYSPAGSPISRRASRKAILNRRT